MIGGANSYVAATWLATSSASWPDGRARPPLWGSAAAPRARVQDGGMQSGGQTRHVYGRPPARARLNPEAGDLQASGGIGKRPARGLSSKAVAHGPLPQGRDDRSIDRETSPIALAARASRAAGVARTGAAKVCVSEGAPRSSARIITGHPSSPSRAAYPAQLPRWAAPLWRRRRATLPLDLFDADAVAPSRPRPGGRVGEAPERAQRSFPRTPERQREESDRV